MLKSQTLLYTDICGLMCKDREMCGALAFNIFSPLEILHPFKNIPVLQGEGKAVETMTTLTAEAWL